VHVLVAPIVRARAAPAIGNAPEPAPELAHPPEPVGSGMTRPRSGSGGDLRGVPDARSGGLENDGRVPSPRRFLVDVQVSDSEIAGSVTDEAGHVRRFVGWLALIAALQPPTAHEHASGAGGSQSDEA
jgi:hypothetical protein